MTKKIFTDYEFSFSKDHEPIDTVKVGEELIFKTLDCFANQLQTEDDLVTLIDFSKVNPATGPVFVEGAKPGDLLKVDILDIEVADRGIITTIPDVGPLSDDAETRTKVIHIDDGIAKFNDIEFEINPMVGVIGVAPKGEEVLCGDAEYHGGNMDNKEIVKGTTLYFPVHVEGALFQLGDLHASMGDGEISGAGLEIPGEVTVKLDIIKGYNLERPVHETDDKWWTIAAAETYEEALKLSTKEMQKLIVDTYGWDKTDAYLYMSVQGDAQICQGTRPSDWNIILRFGIPKQEDKPLIK